MPVTFADKDKTQPTSDARRLVRDVDLNELKNVANANETAIALRLPIGSVVWNEVPSGTINGSNLVFTIANADPSKAAVYADGIRITPTSGFTIIGTTLTMVIAPVGDLLIDYII